MVVEETIFQLEFIFLLSPHFLRLWLELVQIYSALRFAANKYVIIEEEKQLFRCCKTTIDLIFLQRVAVVFLLLSK